MKAITNNMQFVDMFEQIISNYTGFKYAVAVDCCTNAIIMSLQHLLNSGKIKKDDVLTIPKNTYLSIPMTLKLYGWNIQFESVKWHGKYEVGSTGVYDAANDFKQSMAKEYSASDVVCVSFQQKKRLNLDQGGAILLNDRKMYKTLKRMCHDGRNAKITQIEETSKNPNDIILGFHSYMSPETAIRGILIMNQKFLLRPYREYSYKDYSDISKLDVFRT